VILRPVDTYKNKGIDSETITPAEKKAAEILNTRGTAPRTYKNMLAFVAPDQKLLPNLKAAVRDLLAWASIKTDSTDLNLDAGQNAEAASNISRCNETVNTRLKEVYCWLLVPSIDKEEDIKTVKWDIDQLSGIEPIVAKTAAKMRQNELVITKWAPQLLKMELDNLLWKNDPHIDVKTLWAYLTTYCYLPRLADFSVLQETIRAGVAGEEYFALASGIEKGRYTDLRYNKAVLDVYQSDCLVKVKIALEQIRVDNQKRSDDSGGAGDNPPPQPPVPGPGGKPIPPQPPQSNDTRFYMNVKLDNVRAVKELRDYLDEVINHLSSVDDCDVELSLEVSANAKNGFSQETVRTVSENCRTLKINNFGFEK